MVTTVVRIVIVNAAAAALLGLACADASAQLKVGGGGVDVVAPANATATQAVDPATATVRDTRRAGGHTLRCWQNGRLLYEGSGFRGSMSGATAIGVPRRGEGDPVTVLNLNHAVCILADS